MIHFCYQRCFSLSGVVLCLAVLASGQVANSKKFQRVPGPLRDKLVARFNLYIENERTRHYEKLWDLLSQGYIANQRLTRENYLRYRSDDILIEFKPKAVIKSPLREDVNVFEIHGIAKFQRGHKVVMEDRLLETRWQGDDWYFSDWLVQVE